MRKLTIGFLLLLLLLLVACGGSADETVQEAPIEEDAPAEQASDEEAEELAEEPPSAIGSEDEGGALPPPINSGSKVTATNQTDGEPVIADVLFVMEMVQDTAVSRLQLAEDWESMVEQISNLPNQPDINYATLFINPDEPTVLTGSDFTPLPSWEDLTVNDAETMTTATSVEDYLSQLSWQEAGAVQIVFLLVSPDVVDDELELAGDTAVYVPIIPAEMSLTETELLTFTAIADETNGRLIQLNNQQTTLSEQIILSVAQIMAETSE